MDGETLLERLRANHDTELSRLGSSKALYALTGGEMESAAVRSAAATEAAAAGDVVGGWAETASGAAAERFEAVAAAARERAAGFDADAGEARPVYDVLENLETAPARAGGLLGRSVVVAAYAGQFVGFFVGNADPRAAGEFRDVRDAVEGERDAAVDLLEAVCEHDADWDAADEAATAVVEAAYDDYVATLEGMGVEPKNVC
jgi:hypothetical protein